MRAEVELARRGRPVDVGVHRALTGVRRAALEAGTALHAVDVGVGVNRLEPGSQLAEAEVDGAHARRPVRALADTEVLLDPLVMGDEIVDAERLASIAHQRARVVPLGELEVVSTQRDLRIQGRGPADAPAAEQRNGPTRAAVDQRHPDWPPEFVSGLRLPPDEVVGRQVGTGLEQEDVSAALRKLRCHHAASGTRTDDDHVEALAHPGPPAPCNSGNPRYDQSCLIRVASGNWKPISSQAVGPTPFGATKSL